MSFCFLHLTVSTCFCSCSRYTSVAQFTILNIYKYIIHNTITQTLNVHREVFYFFSSSSSSSSYKCIFLIHKIRSPCALSITWTLCCVVAWFFFSSLFVVVVVECLHPVLSTSRSASCVFVTFLILLCIIAIGVFVLFFWSSRIE